MKFLFFSLLSLMTTMSAISQNYEISLAINTRSDTVLLGSYFASRERMHVHDTVVLRNGQGVFRGDRVLPKGMYFLYNEGRILFDIIIGDNQQFGIVADTVDFINQTKFTSSPDNDAFYEFRQYVVARNNRFQQLNEQFRNATTDDERNDIRTKWQDLEKEGDDFIEKLIQDNNHLYASKVVRSFIPLKLPEPPRNELGQITDSMYVYRWYRAHFFDNLNIYDPDMLRTQLYQEKLFDFLNRFIPQHTDTVCVEIDKILTKAKGDDAVFRFIVVTLFNHFLESTDLIRGYVIPENVWAHITEKWYIDFAQSNNSENVDNLKKELNDIKPNLIGKQAPQIEMLMILPPEHFRAAAMDTAIKFDLHAGRMVNDFRRDNQLKSKYTVLFFWDFTCSHCKAAIQELYTVWEENRNKGLQVITVQTHLTERRDKGQWIDYVNDRNMFGTGWHNAWSPYDHKFREYYNIASTPVVYLLDENFDIIIRGNLRRQIGIETIKDFFDRQVQ